MATTKNEIDSYLNKLTDYFFWKIFILSATADGFHFYIKEIG